MSRDEQTYTQDLAVADYPGKWKTAKGMAAKELGTSEGVEYWMLARQRYLELGGEYKDGTRC